MKDSGAEIFKNKMDSRKNQLKASTNFLQIAHHITNELSFNKAESRNSALLEIKGILKFKKQA
jgi:hypothetical protein